MKATIILMACILLFGCAHSPMKFQLAPGTNQNDYKEALKQCGVEDKQGGYFLFGPLILLAPAVAIIEGVKANQRSNVQKCMEEKGFKCAENCPDPTSANFVQKPIDPDILAKWADTIKADKAKEWVLYGNLSKGTIVYYNPQSVSTEEQRYINYREQLKMSPDRTDMNMSYIWRSVRVNCPDRIFKFSDFAAVDKTGNPTDPMMRESNWMNIQETTTVGSFVNKLCREKITQQAEGKEKIN